jgi:hypothetical protein
MPGTKSISKADLERIVGDPRAVDAALAAFEESVKTLATETTRVLEGEPDHWIAIYRGNVVARGLTFGDVLGELDLQGLPRRETLVEHLTKTPRKLVL